MSQDEKEDTTIYKVVVNHEEQYSIWPADRENALSRPDGVLLLMVHNDLVDVNHEEQYSIWPADRENALGWHDAGKTGTKAECLVYIEEVWTDMRPLSLRKKMEESGQTQETAGSAESDDV